MTNSQRGAVAAVSVPSRKGTGYPEEFKKNIVERTKRALGDAFGLTNFGVNLVTLPAGEISSQRHWHHKEDEFIYVLQGELTLITDDGEQTIGAGMVAGFAAGVENGHQLVNRSNAEAVYLEVGDRNPKEIAEYPDIDLRFIGRDKEESFVHKDGTPY
ncbi:MAG: cupin domain-containing protein [Rhodospirillales bacterium]|nr:cupin domain-containing protein [Rhodospirillales bacterium]